MIFVRQLCHQTWGEHMSLLTWDQLFCCQFWKAGLKCGGKCLNPSLQIIFVSRCFFRTPQIELHPSERNGGVSEKIPRMFQLCDPPGGGERAPLGARVLNYVPLDAARRGHSTNSYLSRHTQCMQASALRLAG